MTLGWRRWFALGLLLVGLVYGSTSAWAWLRGLSLVVRAADLQGAARRLADLDTVAETERAVQIPTARGRLEARVYSPVRARQTVLLVTGLHPAGIDEPRLVALARELAQTRVTVVTPAIPELANFDITPVITDEIEQAALWLATGSRLSRDGRVALIGVSFSGGLAIVAAGRPALGGRVTYVLSFGGHDDLPRVIRYLCTGAEPARPSGSPLALPRPHDYGVAVVLLAMAPRVVPTDQVPALRSAVRRFLEASALDRVDRVGAAREFAALRDLALRLPEPSAALLDAVNNRDVETLGARLLPYIDQYGQDAALSPSRSPMPTAPVFLLHGRGDNVVPDVESESLADTLRGHVPVRLLLSDIISHAEADRPATALEIWKLASFWGDVLSR